MAKKTSSNDKDMIVSKFQQSVSTSKTLFELIRDVLLVILIGLFLIWPTGMNNLFKKAGFKEFKAVGIVWKNQTVAAGGQVANAKTITQDLTTQISQLASQPKGATQAELKEILSRITTSDQLLGSADQSLKNIAEQQKTIVGQNENAAGWVYIGHFLPSKNAWDYVNASRLQGGDPTSADLQRGQQLRTTDQLYVRASTPPGEHSTGAVLDLIPRGQIMNIEEVGRTLDTLGGERVWAKVSKAGG